MKITEIEAFTVGVGWKNWIFIKVHNDKGIHGFGEGPEVCQPEYLLFGGADLVRQARNV